IWIFTGIWFVLGCLQAGFMELHPDEAYYWQMSRFLDWGYFHQPPMIAVFIKIGYTIFHNELGVRLITVTASSIGIPILFSLSKTSDYKTFFLAFLGLILTHAGVFMAVPDSPLIFFTLIFLFLLREYLKEDKWLTAIALGIIAAALMYSKYHAIVLFASVLFALPKLLIRKSFWLTVFIGVALFVPHVVWQLENDLVSFKFHWVVREKKSWEFMILLDYLLGQLIMLGPVGILLIIAVKQLPKGDYFDRALKTIIVGFFGFFFVMALRGKVEANWTASAFLPLIVLGSRGLSSNPKLQRYLKPTAGFMVCILIIARAYIASPIAGDGVKLNFPLKGWETWALNVKEKANGSPVFFANSYQLVSQYSFYSGEQGYHFSPLNYNGNQFELWGFDKQIYGDDFALILGSSNDSTKAIKTDGFKTMYCFQHPDYHSYRNLRFKFEEKKFEVPVGKPLELNGLLVNSTDNPINLDSLLQERPLKFFYYSDGKQTPAESMECNGCAGIINSEESKEVSFSIPSPEKTGKHFIRLGLDFALGMPEQNSDFIQLQVIED
ncbi:MAG: ArnT family glycosyltransferase, partial [Flavobacteriales bacterium]